MPRIWFTIMSKRLFSVKLKIVYTMGNNKNEGNKSLDDLKKEFQTMSDDELNRYKGGKKPSNKWNISLGGPTPQ